MISSVAWLPKGAAKPAPELVEPSEEELAAAQSRAAAAAAGMVDDAYSSGDDGDDADEEGDEEEDEAAEERAAAATARAAAAHLSVDASVEAALAELNMDAYDEEDEHVQSARLFGGSGPLTFYASNTDDPYITLPDDDDSDDGSSEFNLRSTDLIILAARTEDDVSHLEVCVYEEATDEEEANLFVHHDLLLPAFPLALAWMDCPPSASEASARGNFVAIGTMLPAIEIWDLDLLDAVEPAAVLGDMMAAASQPRKASKKKKKGKTGTGAAPAAEAETTTDAVDTHTGAVMALAWNVEFRNVLASGSGDSTVKVWDVVRGACEHTLRHHSDKVQSVAWSCHDAATLLSGSFDQTAAVSDVRSSARGDRLTWQLGSDCECVAWHPSSPQVLVSTEDGLVRCWDARAGGGAPPLFTLAAHRKATCTLALSAHAPGLLATGSMDKKTKLWDISNCKPELLATQDVKVGAVFTAAFCRDAPHLLAVAGAQSGVTVWDVSTEEEVRRAFPHLARAG